MKIDPTKLILTVVTAIVLVIAAGFLVIRKGPSLPVMGGDFTLNHRGQDWVFSQHSRPLNLLYVGYVKCPDVCPMSLSVAGQAFRGLNDQQKKDVQLMFISVDFEHDDPESVATYASQFYPEFVGLTGSEEAIRKTINLFGASFINEKNPNSYLGYSITHTDRIFFLNEKGNVVGSIPNPRDAKEILNKITESL